MTADQFRIGDVVICVRSTPSMKLTEGRRYTVHGVREDINFPTVENNEGRLTQYAARWFRKSQEPA